MPNLAIVTTSQAILLVDFECQQWTILHSGSGLYYGVCSVEDKFYVACRNNQNFYDSVDEIVERCELIVFDHSLAEINRLTPGFFWGDAHGICAIDHLIYCTSSADNSVVIFDTKDDSWEKWFPLSERGKDVNHINTINCLAPNQLSLLAHNKGSSEVYVFDSITRELIDSRLLGVHAHNIWLNQKQLCVCSSAQGYLTSNDEFILRTGGFPRGVGYCKKHIVIGISELCRRENRATSNAFLNIYTKSWLLERQVCFEGMGMVLDIFPIQVKVDNAAVCQSMQAFDSYMGGDEILFNTLQADYYLNSEHWHGVEEYRWSKVSSPELTIVQNTFDSHIDIHGYCLESPSPSLKVFIDNHVVFSEKLIGGSKFNFTIKLPQVGRNTYRKLRFEIRNNEELDFPFFVEGRYLGIAINKIKFFYSS